MYRILLADDEGIVRDSLKMIIEKNFPGECEIEMARTGRDVIEMAEEFRPDIVFMDISMPNMDGIEAVKKIKAYDKDAVIVMCSSLGYQEKVLDAINAGASDFIVKPYKPEQIVNALKMALQRKNKKHHTCTAYFTLYHKYRRPAET